MTELPDSVACKLPDLFFVACLSAALPNMWRDLRGAGCHGDGRLPPCVAARYAQAIESFYCEGLLEQQLIAALAAQDESRTVALDGDIESLAHCLQHKHTMPRQRRLYVDISTVAADMKTGIERATCTF